MLKCTDPVDQDCIQLVAENLGIGWQLVLRDLKQTDAFIEQIDRDFQRDGTKEVSSNNQSNPVQKDNQNSWALFPRSFIRDFAPGCETLKTTKRL
jgi:hypothetical protein